MPLSSKLVGEYLNYDPSSGVVRWKKRTGPQCQLGEQAGNVDSNGYRQIQFFGKRYKTTRIIWLLMTGAWPSDEIDHVNRDRADDRWENLRIATHAQNMANQNIMRVNNISGYRGVCWHKSTKKWAVQVKGHRPCHCGLFENKEDAARHYDEIVRALYGEFASTNFPSGFE